MALPQPVNRKPLLQSQAGFHCRLLYVCPVLQATAAHRTAVLLLHRVFLLQQLILKCLNFRKVVMECFCCDFLKQKRGYSTQDSVKLVVCRGVAGDLPPFDMLLWLWPLSVAARLREKSHNVPSSCLFLGLSAQKVSTFYSLFIVSLALLVASRNLPY